MPKSSKNVSKSKPTTYEKNYTPWWSRIYPRNANLVQHSKIIYIIHHIKYIKKNYLLGVALAILGELHLKHSNGNTNNMVGQRYLLLSWTSFEKVILKWILLFSCVCSVTKSRLTLCKTMDCGLPGSSIYGISQARVLEWVAISFSRGSSQPRNRTSISCTGRQILYHWATREAYHMLFIIFMCGI